MRYTHTDGERWSRLGWRTDSRAAEVDFAQLPGGDRLRLAVVATDGVNTTMAESPTFRVVVKPCRAMILAPEDGATVAAGGTVLLRGQGYYLEEVRPETEALAWNSSQDGDLGLGMLLGWSPCAGGEHRVTLVAGTGGRQGTTEITVRVHEPAPSAGGAGGASA